MKHPDLKLEYSPPERQWFRSEIRSVWNQGGFSGVDSMVENSLGGELTDRTYGVREVKDSSGNWVEMPGCEVGQGKTRKNSTEYGL